MEATESWQSTEDWHTEGEPFRIVRDLPAGSLESSLTVAEQRVHILDTPDHPLNLLRQSLCHEPRGHADMYGGFILPPNDDGAHFGVLFFHKDGFSTACGHGTIALGYWALAHGLVRAPSDGVATVVIDVPSGRVTARATCENGAVKHIDFVNVPSYQVARDVPTSVSLAGQSIPLKMNFGFGGAVYACVDVSDLGLEIAPRNHQIFIDLQRQIKRQHTDYLFEDRYDIYGVCFFKHIEETESSITQKNVVIFADGQIDRSPCGSGTAARAAILLAQGKMGEGKVFKHYSIIDTVFEAGLESHGTESHGTQTCIPWVRGTARLVGRMNFYIDPSDPLYPGFLLR